MTGALNPSYVIKAVVYELSAYGPCFSTKPKNRGDGNWPSQVRS